MNSLGKRARGAGSQKSAAVIEQEAANEDLDSSSFEVTDMPVDQIRRRLLHQHSCHYSLPSSCWIATIVRLDNRSTETKRMPYSQFAFASEEEAKKFCKAYSPPKMMEVEENCSICNVGFTAKVKPFHCRNCGTCICDKCTTRWSARMVPKTYIHSAYQPQVVRVCRSCDWLSNSFCLSLLKGCYQDALTLYDTGNVNLRTCFAGIRSESMFPVHCAVLGGNLQILQWLVEKQLCPMSVKRDSKGKMLSVKTSNDRTLIDLAMAGKPKLDILHYLVVAKGLSVSDCADSSLMARTLEALLKSGVLPGGPEAAALNRAMAVVDPSESSLGTVENSVSLSIIFAIFNSSICNKLTPFRECKVQPVLYCAYGLCVESLWSHALLLCMRVETRDLSHV